LTRLNPEPGFRLVAALVLAILLGWASTPAVAGAAGHASYRFVGAPTVAFSKKDPRFFWVYWRLDRAAPSVGGDDGYDTYTTLDRTGKGNDTGDTTTMGVGRRAKHCYNEVINQGLRSRALRHPRIGRRVTVRLYVHGQREQTTHVRLSGLDPTDPDTSSVRRLGCR
jgi:hypothetical protein